MKFASIVFVAFSLSVSASVLHAKQFSALVFSDAYDQYHHRNVPAVREAFEFLSKKHFFDLTWVERDAEFGKQTFADFDVIVFVSANPCELSEEKRVEFQKYVASGGGIVGIHSASATAKEEKRWMWWEELVGRVFLSHPPRQTGLIEVVDREFPACLHLDQKWIWTDEWYTFATPFPENLNVLLEVDEKSYYPQEKHVMGESHPIAWYHEAFGGRVFYSALGHIEESYADHDFQQHIFGGMLWAVGERDPKW
ncbi:ThuA domain-containing protein [Pelagicoccus sp. NFK12]|uniref:ThuA domain-containing protein n=1 Tax=Pelagicoccus enzymogenes TaxID=2773457 RepID=A0A927F7V7_9BACT|nr:ThuA domain-containing protein [Pelagicoccus enzymogenes]MBD5778548.1 ThuA domain-containing protein [Pelagicoccus enzymogenes]MDQ8197091.1 ThuA domain-containing protein [Pelagicoccus enzymogenes]